MSFRCLPPSGATPESCVSGAGSPEASAGGPTSSGSRSVGAPRTQLKVDVDVQDRSPHHESEPEVKMRMNRQALTWPLLVAALFGLGCAAGAPESGLTEADRAEIAALSKAYGEAWIAEDTAAVMAVFSDDAALVPHRGSAQAEGPAEIREHFWPPDAPAAPTIEFWRQSSSIEGSASMAYDRGRYRVAFVFEGDTIGSEGNYLAVARRDPEGWKWIAYTWNHP